MRSTTDARRWVRRAAAALRAPVLGTTLLMAALSPAGAAAQPRTAPAASARPDDAEIARAIATVKADPNLATERTITMLQLDTAGDRSATGRPGWMKWIAGLVRWFEQSARVLIWVAAAVAAGLLARYIVRTVWSWDAAPAAGEFIAPTHVQDLDIRPETLPEDIGAAARQLWDRGEHRAGLALLYRGLLSRLVHVHDVPIRDSSTEGDCLALAAGHLTTGGHDYTARLVSIWQRAVYGHERADTSIVHALCDDFAPALDAGPRESAA